MAPLTRLGLDGYGVHRRRIVGAAYVLPCVSGSFVLSGQPIALRIGHSTTVVSGAFASNGQPIVLRVGRIAAAATGSFNLSGKPAGLIYSAAGNKTLAAAPGAFALNGNASTLRFARLLSALKGAIVLSGSTTALVRGRPLVAGTGVFLATGVPVNLVYHQTRRLDARGTQVNLSGRVAFLSRSGTEQPGRIEFGTRVYLRAW